MKGSIAELIHKVLEARAWSIKCAGSTSAWQTAEEMEEQANKNLEDHINNLIDDRISRAIENHALRTGQPL